MFGGLPSTQPLSGLQKTIDIFTQGFKANPGLELANAFSVKSTHIIIGTLI
jgi:hypothetical protein